MAPAGAAALGRRSQWHSLTGYQALAAADAARPPPARPESEAAAPGGDVGPIALAALRRLVQLKLSGLVPRRCLHWHWQVPARPRLESVVAKF